MYKQRVKDVSCPRVYIDTKTPSG